MKIGIIISVVIVIIFGALMFVAIMGFPDNPSRTIGNPHAMEKQVLPADLPAVSQGGGSGDVEPLYDQVIQIYEQQKGVFQDTEPPRSDSAERMADLLIRAMEEGDVRPPFMDKYFQWKVGERPAYGDAMQYIPQSMILHADRLKKEGKLARAVKINRALWTMGRRMFENCTHFDNRFAGLEFFMLPAWTELYNWSENDPALSAQVDPWLKPLQNIHDAWRSKVEVVKAVEPHIGDLLYIAENDNDVSFRAEAIMRMGIAKFHPRSRGNLRAIENAIARYKRSGNPAIQRAAEAADAFTKEDLRSIR